MKLQRMWINQPSELQFFHNLHGTLVLAEINGNGARIYFLSGPVISQDCFSSALSPGWPEHLVGKVS